MVKMACIDCGAVVIEASSLREMLTLMMPHYFEAHQDIMSSRNEERDTRMNRFTEAYNHAAEG